MNIQLKLFARKLRRKKWRKMIRDGMNADESQLLLVAHFIKVAGSSL